VTTPDDTPRRAFKIPLPGDPVGVDLIVPTRPLTPDEWEHLLVVLEAFRPGLTNTPTSTEEAGRG